MRRLLSLGISVLAVLWLWPAAASASTLADCLARQHVCVSGSGRGLISPGQEAKLEQQIGGADIYLVVASAGASGYSSTMSAIIGDLNGHSQFTIGFLDSQRRHFGAYNKGMLRANGAADIATQVVRQHQADQNIFAALTDFVKDVKQEATGSGTGTGGAPAASASHALLGFLITAGVIVVLAGLGVFFIARPIRERRRRELKDVKAAAQDDLIALSEGITDRDTNVDIQNHPEAAAEVAAALTSYDRGTAALDAVRRVSDMGAVSRAIAEGHYRLACAEALAAGRPRPDRRPACFFDPRHGMSVRDVYWTPADGSPGRTVAACSACAHKVDQGIEPEMRELKVDGEPVSYVNAGFGGAYWGGYGFGPGMFTGFLLGEALGSGFGYPGGYPTGDDRGGDDFGGGGGDGGGDGGFGGGDFGGGGGGDFGGGDFGGGGGGDFS